MTSTACFEEAASFTFPGRDVMGITALPAGGYATRHRLPGHEVIQVWSESGALEAKLEGHVRGVSALACTPSGDIVSTAEHTVKVWRDNACVLTLEHTFAKSVAVSPLDGTIVCGSWSRNAKVWSPSTGTCVATLAGHKGYVTAVCVLDNGDVVTASMDKTVRVWDRGPWTCTAVHNLPESGFCLAVLPRGGFAVGGGRGAGFLSVWRHGVEAWSLTASTLVYQVEALNDFVFVCRELTLDIVLDGSPIASLSAIRPYVAVRRDRKVVVADCQRFGGGNVCRVFRVVRPSRMATIHTMISAWSAHGGVPPPLPGPQSRAAVVARTLSLRRFCRVRGGEGAEVVEPFARDIVGYM